MPIPVKRALTAAAHSFIAPFSTGPFSSPSPAREAGAELAGYLQSRATNNKRLDPSILDRLLPLKLIPSCEPYT